MGIRIWVVVLTFGASLSLASAGRNSWSSVGPDGGFVARIWVDPGRPIVFVAVYTSASPELYRSSDGGRNWVQFSGPNPAEKFTLHAIGPDSSVYGSVTTVGEAAPTEVVGRIEGGSYTWSALARLPVISPGTTTSVTGIATDPVVFSRIYAGTFPPAIFRSDDQGMTWQLLRSDLALFATPMTYPRDPMDSSCLIPVWIAVVSRI